MTPWPPSISSIIIAIISLYLEGSSIKLDHFCEVSGFLCLHYYDYDDEDDDDYEDDDDDANYDDDYENDDDKMRKGNLDLNTLSIKLFSALFEFWIVWLARGVLGRYFKRCDYADKEEEDACST